MSTLLDRHRDVCRDGHGSGLEPGVRRDDESFRRGPRTSHPPGSESERIVQTRPSPLTGTGVRRYISPGFSEDPTLHPGRGAGGSWGYLSKVLGHATTGTVSVLTPDTTPARHLLLLLLLVSHEVQRWGWAKAAETVDDRVRDGADLIDERRRAARGGAVRLDSGVRAGPTLVQVAQSLPSTRLGGEQKVPPKRRKYKRTEKEGGRRRERGGAWDEKAREDVRAGGRSGGYSPRPT